MFVQHGEMEKKSTGKPKREKYTSAPQIRIQSHAVVLGIKYIVYVNSFELDHSHSHDIFLSACDGVAPADATKIGSKGHIQNAMVA